LRAKNRRFRDAAEVVLQARSWAAEQVVLEFGFSAAIWRRMNADDTVGKTAISDPCHPCNPRLPYLPLIPFGSIPRFPFRVFEEGVSWLP